MKNNLWFFLLTLFVLTGLTFFDKDEQLLPVFNPEDSQAKRLPVIQGTHVTIVSPDEVSVEFTLFGDGSGKSINVGIWPQKGGLIVQFGTGIGGIFEQ